MAILEKLRNFKIFLNKKSIWEKIICIVFCLSFLSIPFFSMSSGLLPYITWVFTAATLGLVCVYLIIYKIEIKIDTRVLLFAGFIFSFFISTALNGFKQFNFTAILLCIVSLILLLFFRENQYLVKSILNFIFYGLLIYVIFFAYINRKTVFSLSSSRPEELLGDINDNAIFIALTFSLSLSKMIQSLRKRKFLNFFLATIYLICLLFSLFVGFRTGSKVFILTVLVSTIGQIFIFFGKKIYLSLITFACLSGVILLVWFAKLPFLSVIQDRLNVMIKTFFEAEQTQVDMSTINRLDMFLDGLTLFLRKPLFGFGTRAFFIFGSHGQGWSHNTYSELLASYGLVGTVFFLGNIFISIKDMFDLRIPWEKRKVIILYTLFFVTISITVVLESEKIFAYFIPLVYSYSYSKENKFESLDL